MDRITLKSVTKNFAKRKVLDSIDLHVGRGSVHGFLGPNGAGKSTTMKIISGILTPDSGEVIIDGLPLFENETRLKAMVGVLPENPPLYLDMRVDSYLKFVSDLYKQSTTQYQNELEKLIDLLGLEHVYKRVIGNLSRGYRQKVAVAQALIHNPDILLFDEPTLGLDPGAVVEMRNLVKKLGEEKTILLSSHLLHEVSLCCDHLTIINHGKIVRTGTLSEIENSLHHQKVIRGVVARIKDQAHENLLKINGVEKCDLDYATNSFKIYLNDKADRREEISKFFIDNQMGLLEFREESLDLEKIFMQVTGGES